MGLTRRAFLQQTTLGFAALGLSQTGFSLLADRYQQALAQPTRRKLALLVGINQYPEQVSDIAIETLRSRSSVRGSALTGCLTDVELQRELLIHRFGFQPGDVLTLTDQQATRQAIESTFSDHLIDQARSGDVVLFHFSGLGSQVRLGEIGASYNTLVPVDGMLPTEENPAINDLFEATLALLLRSLKTQQITTVLDFSYCDSGQAGQGLRARARPSVPTGQLNPAEQAVQEQLLNQLSSTPNQNLKARDFLGVMDFPGTVLAAARSGQVATEGQWSNFSAGLFTYALTQQLWWTMPPTTLHINLSRAAMAIEQRIGTQQQPQLSGQASLNPKRLTYDLHPVSPGVDGVITRVDAENKTVQVWLAGLPAVVLENYGVNSLLTLQSHDTKNATETPDLPLSLLQIRSREGLSAIARIVNPEAIALPQVGELIQEAVRILPRDIHLTVALDTSLERIERVDATSAFAAIARVSVVASGEPSIDYLFGKTQPPAPTLAASLPLAALPIEESEAKSLPSEELPAVKSSYGLFYLGRAAIPNTLTGGDQAIKTAVNRLTPQLRTLLATKLIRLTENVGSSRLGVRATLETLAPQPQVVIQQETTRAPWQMSQQTSRLQQPAIESIIPTLPIGSHICYRLQNYSDRPVYFVLVGLDGNGGAIALYPESATDRVEPDPNTDGMILPGSTLTIPSISDSSGWILRRPTGRLETHLIFSQIPLTQTHTVLMEARGSQEYAPHVGTLSKPLEVAQAILQDLHQASTVNRTDFSADTYLLDVNCWATLSFAYHLTEA